MWAQNIPEQRPISRPLPAGVALHPLRDYIGYLIPPFPTKNQGFIQGVRTSSLQAAGGPAAGEAAERQEVLHEVQGLGFRFRVPGLGFRV